MKNFLLIYFFILSLSTHSYADDYFDPDTTAVILESDKEPGRFFEDQPDVTAPWEKKLGIFQFN